MSEHQALRRYVARVAANSPLTPRLRKLVGRKLPTGENEALADVIDRATLKLCGEQTPYFIRSVPDLWPTSMARVRRAIDADWTVYRAATAPGR